MVVQPARDRLLSRTASKMSRCPLRVLGGAGEMRYKRNGAGGAETPVLPLTAAMLSRSTTTVDRKVSAGAEPVTPYFVGRRA